MTVAPEFPPAAAARGTEPAAPRAARRHPEPRALRVVPSPVEQPTRSGAALAGAVERSPLRRGPGERPATRPAVPVAPRVAGRSRHERPAAGRDRGVPAGRPAGRRTHPPTAGPPVAAEPAGGPVALVEQAPDGTTGLTAWPGRVLPFEAPEPGAGAGREHRPAAPALRPAGPGARRRPTGARVIRPAQPRLRLSRRGRAVLVVLWIVAATVVLTVGITRFQSVTSSAPLPDGAPTQVTVAPGETLWGIAERVAPSTDPRDVIAQIRRLNDLGPDGVRAGQVLRLTP
jgi:hypothetical protein